MMARTDAAPAEPEADPVAALQRQVEAGHVRLDRNDRNGYLESLLHALHVSKDSQALVFSKTSFQAGLISPRTPRAIYFNDDLYVGWVHSGQSIEIAAIDPKQGPVFYLLPQEAADRPRFLRETDSCMQCHQSQVTGDVPGLLMRSVYPDHTGMPVFSAGSFNTTDQSPFKERWGGWYMDRAAGARPGMGDATYDDEAHPVDLHGAAADLSAAFDTSDYLSSHADGVALAVLTHQVHLHNLMTRADCETRRAIREQDAVDAALGRPRGEASQSTTDRIASACEPLVRGILFSGERFSTPLAATTGFAKGFTAQGPLDGNGRSLRDFDLNRRLFRFPCSYLIYSEQFDALPDVARNYVYRRIWEVLTGRDDAKPFDHLSDDDRNAIYDILFATRKSLPAYWRGRR